MNWNKNPPPPGVNPQYSSFHYQANRFEPESVRPKFDDYSHKPGRPGGGWDAEEDSVPIPQPISTRPETFTRPARDVPEPLPVREQPRVYETKPTLSVSEQAGVYEKVLVSDITAPGGVRPRPSDKDMHEFVTKCKYLTPEIIMTLLFALLDNPQRFFKSLCVIEKLAMEYEVYANIVGENLDIIRRAASNQASQKVVSAILARFNEVPPEAGQANIIDLF